MVTSVRNRRAIWVAVLLVSVGLRVALALHYGDSVPVDQDEHSYSQLAWRVATGHGYTFERPWYPFTPADTPTAHWSFLYTALVAGVYRIVGYHPLVVRLTSAVATGFLLPWVVYRVTRRAFPERRTVALVAAIGAAGYAYFITFGARIMTEGLYIVALLWSLDSALAVADDLKQSVAVPLAHSLQLGLSLGTAVLLRQAILPWVPLLFVWLLLNVGTLQRLKPHTLKPLIVAGLVLIACILPWTLRNCRVYGSFLLLNSNTGYAMYSAQHPMHGTDFQEYEAAPLPEDLLRGDWIPESEIDRALLARGISFVLAEPRRYLLLSVSRLWDFFVFWPTHGTPLLNNVGRLVSFTAFLPFMVYGSVLTLQQAWRASDTAIGFLRHPAMLLLGFVCFYTLLHALTWAMPRYRIPADAVMMPFAAIAVLDLHAKVTRDCRGNDGISAVQE